MSKNDDLAKLKQELVALTFIVHVLVDMAPVKTKKALYIAISTLLEVDPVTHRPVQKGFLTRFYDSLRRDLISLEDKKVAKRNRSKPF